MITTMQMYWLVVLDSIVTASVICFSIGLLASVASIGIALDTNDHWWMPWFAVPFTLLSMLTATFVPSTKQAAAIVIVPKIVNNEKVQMVGNQLYDLAVDWLRELRPPTKEHK